ncbi:hypothetical protein [Nocardia sp. CC227C]|uniref:hypothetical protein n=1 Tax=Nocardia sp. CC227C TaxID=3044562 RepID=UPI00278C012E|nr:hypothetical protein [Nocardia sp. CC227C]
MPQKPRAAQPVHPPRLTPAGASTGHTAPDPGVLEAGLEALTDEVRRRLNHGRPLWFDSTGTAPYSAAPEPPRSLLRTEPPIRATPAGLVAAALGVLSRIGGAAKTVLGVWR